ncbi:MAG: VWA domain-containing protein [Vicinamibacterales bacterium]
MLCWSALAAAQMVAPTGQQPVFKAESRLVVLHVSVRDRGGRYVTGLTKDAFTVIDDGQPQSLEMFSADAVPASIGLLIDNSNSMAPSRERVIAATSAFARNSHPQDEVFVLTFNEHVREAWAPAIIADTRPQQFAEAVAGAITARGMTALYDGVAEGLRRVKQGAHTRQVLILLSDGGDNASKTSQQDIIRDSRRSDAVIYTVGLTDPLMGDGNPGLLRRLARETGGESYRPRTTDKVPETLERIARDIRSAYTLAYAPAAGLGKDNRRRTVRVYVRSPDGRVLRVRVRDGYYAEPAGSHQ